MRKEPEMYLSFLFLKSYLKNTWTAIVYFQMPYMNLTALSPFKNIYKNYGTVNKKEA